MACPVVQENSQEQLIQHLESAIPPFDGTESGGEILAWIAPKLNTISPDGDDKELCRIVRAVHKHLAGDDDGLELLCRWCSRGNNDRSRSEIEDIWRSIQPAPVNPSESAVTDVQVAAPQDVVKNTAASTPLDKYSLRDMVSTIEANAIAAVAILGQLVLKGQFVFFFAAANTGKTLLVLYLLIEAIRQGRIDPSKVYYLDMDDNSTGLLEKLRIANELGFHILAEGYQNFSVKKFMVEIMEMIENDQAKGVVVILDTYKKFANVMDKSQSSQFNQLLRRFVMKGGTVVALAHTNKRLGMNGKPIHGGTSDSLDDCDCAYTIRAVLPQDSSAEKVIEVENIKGRGGVPQEAFFVYSIEPNISYDELLASVQSVADAQSTPLKQAAQLKTEQLIIDAVVACIGDGIDTKMKLRNAVSERTGASLRDALRLIESHTGNDPALHHWKYSVRERGAKVYSLLGPASPPTTSEGSSN